MSVSILKLGLQARPPPAASIVKRSLVLHAVERSAGQPSTSSSSNTPSMPKISLSDALAPKEEAPLKPIMKGYRSIRLHGVEFLVSTTEDGFLDLNDAFYIEDGSEEYKRPAMRGELPKTRLKYQEFPWSNFISGQVFKFKEQKFQVMKMLLVRIAEGPEYQLDLDTCFVIDSEKKEIFQPRIEKVGEPKFPILRFRRDTVVIEDQVSAAPWTEVATEARLGVKNETWWHRGAQRDALAAAMVAGAAASAPSEDEDLDKLGDDQEAFDEDFFGAFEEEEDGEEGGSYE